MKKAKKKESELQTQKESCKVFLFATLRPINDSIKKVYIQADNPLEAMSRIATLDNFFNLNSLPTTLIIENLEEFKENIKSNYTLFLPKGMSLQKDI